MTILTHPVFRPLLCLLVVVIWSVNFVAIHIAIDELAPQMALAMRFALTALLYLPFIKWPERAQLKKIFMVSFFLCTAHQGFLFASYLYLNTGTISVMLQTQVVFSVLMGALFFGEKIGWRMITGIVLSFMGLIVIFGAPQMGETPLGFFLILMSALTIAYGYVAMKNLDDVHGPTFLCLINAMGLPFILALTLLFEDNHIEIMQNANWLKVLPVFAFQAFLVSGCHFLWQRLLTLNPVGTIVPFTLLLPVFGITASVILLGEIATPALVLGGGITLLGVSIITLRRLKKNNPIPVEGLE